MTCGIVWCASFIVGVILFYPHLCGRVVLNARLLVLCPVSPGMKRFTDRPSIISTLTPPPTHAELQAFSFSHVFRPWKGVLRGVLETATRSPE